MALLVAARQPGEAYAAEAVRDERLLRRVRDVRFGQLRADRLHTQRTRIFALARSDTLRSLPSAVRRGVSMAPQRAQQHTGT